MSIFVSDSPDGPWTQQMPPVVTGSGAQKVNGVRKCNSLFLSPPFAAFPHGFLCLSFADETVAALPFTAFHRGAAAAIAAWAASTTGYEMHFIGGNPTAIILPNGTTLVMFRGGGDNHTECRKLGVVVRSDDSLSCSLSLACSLTLSRSLSPQQG